jgi:hypothetical protein
MQKPFQCHVALPQRFGRQLCLPALRLRHSARNAYHLAV